MPGLLVDEEDSESTGEEAAKYQAIKPGKPTTLMPKTSTGIFQHPISTWLCGQLGIGQWQTNEMIKRKNKTLKIYFYFWGESKAKQSMLACSKACSEKHNMNLKQPLPEYVCSWQSAAFGPGSGSSMAF